MPKSDPASSSQAIFLLANTSALIYLPEYELDAPSAMEISMGLSPSTRSLCGGTVFPPGLLKGQCYFLYSHLILQY
jgi:hypothetical protein